MSGYLARLAQRTGLAPGPAAASPTRVAPTDTPRPLDIDVIDEVDAPPAQAAPAPRTAALDPVSEPRPAGPAGRHERGPPTPAPAAQAPRRMPAIPEPPGASAPALAPAPEAASELASGRRPPARAGARADDGSDPPAPVRREPSPTGAAHQRPVKAAAVEPAAETPRAPRPYAAGRPPLPAGPDAQQRSGEPPSPRRPAAEPRPQPEPPTVPVRVRTHAPADPVRGGYQSPAEPAVTPTQAPRRRAGDEEPARAALPATGSAPRSAKEPTQRPGPTIRIGEVKVDIHAASGPVAPAPAPPSRAPRSAAAPGAPALRRFYRRGW